MHNPPAVSFPLERSRLQGWFLAFVWLSGALVSIYGCAVADAMGWRQYLALALVAGLGVSAMCAWRKSPTGILHWDGQCWWLKTQATSTTGTISVHLDLQFFFLMRLRSESGRIFWLWLDRPSTSPYWGAIRRAAFSRSTGDAPQISGEISTPGGIKA